MKEEFNLSEKIVPYRFMNEGKEDYIYINDVKEFIRLLKEKAVTPYRAVELMERQPNNNFRLLCFIDIDEIDKLAGDKLK